MGHAAQQRHAFSEALLAVDADAPTLCEGWTAYDLAAHCWVREHRPQAALGIVAQRFEHLAADEMAKAKERFGYVELAKLLAEAPRTPVTAVPGGDDLVNAVEFLVHTEDVRRANGLPVRPISADFEEVLWKRLSTMGRLMFRSAPCGVRLERLSTSVGPAAHVKAGASTVSIIGRPSEIVLFAFGRQAAADVRLIGEPDEVRLLSGAKLGI